MAKYTKNTCILLNYVLHGHAKDFTSSLEILELQKTLHPDNASELRMEDESRNHRKADKLSVVRRFSDYLLPFHPYGDNHNNQREFDGNVVALMEH